MSEKKTKLQKMKVKIDNLATMIELEIAKLDNYMGECHCNRDKGFVNVVHQGEFYEATRYCLSCGGTVQV